MKLREIWEFSLSPQMLNELSLADLLALETYLHRKGEGKTNNYNILNQAILKKINKLSI